MENTIENNILIAKFMGWTYDYSGIKWAVPTTDSLIPECDNYKSGTRVTDDELKFHKDWNWLMPVVNHVHKSRYVNTDFLYNQLNNYTIDIVYSEAVEFIKWYNSKLKEG